MNREYKCLVDLLSQLVGWLNRDKTVKYSHIKNSSSMETDYKEDKRYPHAWDTTKPGTGIPYFQSHCALMSSTRAVQLAAMGYIWSTRN